MAAKPTLTDQISELAEIVKGMSAQMNQNIERLDRIDPNGSRNAVGINHAVKAMSDQLYKNSATLSMNSERQDALDLNGVQQFEALNITVKELAEHLRLNTERLNKIDLNGSAPLLRQLAPRLLGAVESIEKLAVYIPELQEIVKTNETNEAGWKWLREKLHVTSVRGKALWFFTIVGGAAATAVSTHIDWHTLFPFLK